MQAPIVSVEDLTKVYRSRRRGEVRAVDGVSFDVAPGEIVGILGPNGAGKTTTIKCLCTLLTPTSGRLVVDGVDVTSRPRMAAQKVAAVLEGNRNIYWRLSAKENLEFFAALQGIPRSAVQTHIGELIEGFHLTGARDADARTLSRGMQQKLAVACAFVKQTPILLLDEPTLGLDLETSYELREMLRTMAGDAGRTILLSSHDMNVVQDVCERVIIVNNGKIVTSDRVANLLDLFRIRSYSFTVRGCPNEEALRDEFKDIDMQADGPLTEINVELLDGARIYDLIDALRASDCVIESIDRREPNLGDVFLRIVRGEVRQ